jgi:hypothetical protein
MPIFKSGPPPTTTLPASENSERGGQVARLPEAARAALAACAALLTTACGGGVPLFHGAHTLGRGATAQGAGFSGTFALGDARSAAASQAPEQSAAIDALAPRVAPWVNARIGLGAESEAGLTYTARAIRLDARHAFEDGSVALSVGAGASGILRTRDPVIEGNTVRSAPGGFGFDVPVLVGWRSDAGVVTLWAGARGGFEMLGADRSTAHELDLRRWYGGAVVGFGLGFRHVHGAIELDTYYQSVSGSLGAQNVRLTGVTLTPGAGLILTF